MTLRERFIRRVGLLSARSRSGSAMLEFALVAPIFFILLLGILETGVIYFAQATLLNATQDAGRLIRTGQAQDASMTQQQFRTQICNEISAILPCNSNLQIDVESYSSFGSASYGSPLTGSGTLNPALDNYETGNPGDVVLVRVFYQWSVITPLLTPFLVNLGSSTHLITATTAFRNEPFN